MYILFLEFEMALSEAWLKANNGKEREAVDVIADRDSMSVRISPKGKIVFPLLSSCNAECRHAATIGELFSFRVTT